MLALVWLAGGCDSASTLADPSDAAIDGSPPPAERARLLGDEALALSAGEAPGRVDLVAGGVVLARGLAPRVIVAGQAIDAEGWQLVGRTRIDGALTIEYRSALEGQLVARLTWAFEDTVLIGRLDLEATQAAVSIDAVYPLTAEGAERGFLFAQGHRLDADARFVPARQAGERTTPSALLMADHAVLLEAESPGAQLRVTFSADATAGGVGVRLEAPHAVGTLLPGTALTASFAVATGGTLVEAQAAFARRVAAAGAERAPLRGWRTAAALGLEPSGDALLDELDALRALSGERRPAVLLEGRWYASHGDWRWAPNVSSAMDALTRQAELLLDWPLLATEPGAPLAVALSDALIQECSGLPCPRLDARQPAVRDALAEQWLAWLSEGIVGAPTALGALDGPIRAALLDRLVEVGRRPPTLDQEQVPITLSAAARLPPELDLGALLAHLALRWPLGSGQVQDVGPLRILGADAATRQARATAALIGGVVLLADAPSALGGDAASSPWAQRALGSPDPGAMAPLRWSADAPPVDWVGPRALALFNPGEAPRTVERPAELAPHLLDARRLWSDEPTPLGASGPITIAPGGAVMWVSVDDAPQGG